VIGEGVSKGGSGSEPAVVTIAVYGFALLVVTALGAANLHYPFGLDQALIFHGAKAMDQGAIYYVDFWDNKQPGLYWFYLIAGRLFGFTEFGIHFLEFLWMLAFAGLQMVALRGAFRQPWLSAVVPIATIGVYYAMSGEYELTQLEFLVAFPLFAFVLCLLGASKHPRGLPALYFLSGLLAGVVVLFKLLLAPLCVALWLIALGYMLVGRKQGIVALFLKAVLPASLGVVLVLGSVVLLYHQWGHLDALLWTAFVYPPQALAIAPQASKSRLVTALAFFLSEFAPWALFALGGAAAWAWRRRDLPGALLLTWFVMAIVLFLVQRFSWWQYHTLLGLFPAGLFAVMGIDSLAAWFEDNASAGRRLAPALAAVVALTATAGLTHALVAKVQPLLSTTVMNGKSLRHYQSSPKISEFYGIGLRSVRFLKQPDALPGPIYVLGNPMIYEFSGRPAPHPLIGTSWKFYLPAQINDVLATLDRQQVPYVYLGPYDGQVLHQRPRLARYLKEKYVLDHSERGGRWLRRREL